MDFIADSPWFSALLIVGAIVGATKRWIWPLLSNVVHTIEAMPILIEIAEQFKPNGGDTLRDKVDTINIRLENIEQQIEKSLEEN